MIIPKWRAVLASWHLPFTLAAASGLLAWFGPDLNDALRYQRAAILDGELWRLFSAHLVHLGWSHWVLNVAGLALVWALLEDELAGIFGWVALLGSGLAIGLGLLLFDPELQWYVGLSGVLHGLFAAGAVRHWPAQPRAATLMLVVLAVKLGWEQYFGAMPGTGALAGGAVIVDAHLFGAIGGVIIAWAYRYTNRAKPMCRVG
ncbi:MAG: rhombosortase [Gammaproteobacteria bacterium]